MREEIMTPAVMDDIADFWKKYREEHGIGKNVVLMVVDVDRSLEQVLGRVMNQFIDAVLSQRRHGGGWVLKPALKLKEEGETIYPMTDEETIIQIDCRNDDCRYYRPDGGCTNMVPAITLNPSGRYVCWSKEDKEEEKK